MKCRLRKIYDDKTWLVEKDLTSIGKDSCDIKVRCKLSVVERKHAFISVDEEQNAFTLSDNNSTHGTYLNDRRLQHTNVRLKQGDIIRLGHGGPRFEVILEDTPAEDKSKTNMSNLPTISVMPSSAPYGSHHYSKYNGFSAHTKSDKSNVVPHPPVRQRPVSANPAHGAFQPSTKPTITGNWINGFSNGDELGNKTFDSSIDYSLRLPKTDDLLPLTINYETECHKKESVIETLREEIDYLRSCIGTNQSSGFTTGCHQKIAALHNQIQVKNEDNDNLRTENTSLRVENDNLRAENKVLHTDKDIRTENNNLREENERLKSSSHDIGHQISEMKMLLTQRDHKVALLENELTRINKEKSQMALLLNTLQKEITSKDENLRKCREDLEKYKIELRNKKNEISTMAARLSKSTELKERARDLKQKEEEVSSLKYRMKSLDDKIVTKDTHIQELHERITEANNKIDENENNYNMKLNDIRYQVKTLEEKLRAKDLLVQDLNVKLSETQYTLSAKEKKQLEESTIEIEATKNLSGILCEIENRLIENGRSCKSINDEIDRLQFFSASDHLRWVKECFLSLLSQESNWEQEIEDALKLVTGDSERAYTPPNLLIQILHEKLDKNDKEIATLESKVSSMEQEHAKFIDDLKISVKDKYKQKAEKAIKEMRNEEKKSCEEELRKVRAEEESRLAEALESEKLLHLEDTSRIQELTDQVMTLQGERSKIKNEFEILQMNFNQSKSIEDEFKEKLEEVENEKKVSVMLTECKVDEANTKRVELEEQLKGIEETCNGLKESNNLQLFEIEELRPYKERVKEQKLTINSLEYKVSSLQQGKSCMEEKIDELHQVLKGYQNKEMKVKEEKDNAESLTNDIEELLKINEELKKTAEEVKNECEDEKLKTQKVKEELNAALANLSDLKADLSEKDKQKIEHLEEKCTKQEKELLDQQMHLVKLSTLVDEQKKKLVEQDQRLKEQNEMLVDRHIPWATRDSPVPVGSQEYPGDLKIVGERCINKKHDEIISEQKDVIEDMHRSLVTVDKLSPLTISTIRGHPQHLIKMSSAIEDLKVELAVQEHQSAVTDQELYDDVCRLQQLLVVATEELSAEQLAHKNNLHALEECEEMYLKFVHDTNKELDIAQILGARPISFSLDDERAKILTERGKGLEVIVNRIKALKSRIERKDQLLEHYDDDLKNLRDTENYAGKKSYEVNNLQKDLTDARTEISYLQESLKKWRGECDDLKRQNTSLKQKTVLMVDYNASGDSMKTKKPKTKQKLITT